MTTEQLTALGISQEEYSLFGCIEKLYLDVSQRLHDAVEELEWIELEAGQLEIPQENYPAIFPCALIDFPAVEYQQETKGNQQGLITLQVRIGVDLYEDLYFTNADRSPDTGTALKRLALITKVHAALMHFETDYSTPLERLGIQMERRDDGIKVFALLYGCAAKDDTGAKRYDVIEGLTLKLNKTERED